MSSKDTLQALEDFSQALGCETALWGRRRSGLLAVRRVAGEEIRSYFRVSGAARPPVPRDDKFALRNIRSQNPRAYLWLITQFKPPADTVAELAAEGIRLASFTSYLNETLDSRTLASRIIDAADRYIPEKRYVEQRVEDSDLTATKYVLEEWLPNPDDVAQLVVLAPAGHGKTCLAHHLARRLASEHLRDEKQPIPFFMPLHFYHHVREFEELVLTHMEANRIHGITSAAFAHLVNNGRCIPILDGFDELAEMGGAKVARKTHSSLLREFRAGSRSILTSRQAFFRHRGDIEVDDQFRTIDLEPFNASERKLFFVKQGVPDGRLELHEQMIKSVSQDEDIPGNPLMLWAVVEAARGWTAPDPRQYWTGAALLKFCLEQICERELERQPEAISVRKQIDYMTLLAEWMFDSDTYVLQDCDPLMELMAEDLLPGRLSDEARVEERDKLVQMLKHHAFLQVESGFTQASSNSISFVHPVFRDYLIANSIAELVERSALSNLRSRIKTSLPRTTVEFLADVVDLPKMAQLVVGVPRSREFKSVIEMILKHCDRVSEDDLTQRSQEFAKGLGQVISIRNQDLSGIEFRSLRFADFSFQGTDFTESVFQNCHFSSCDFTGALLYSTRFFGCVAEKNTIDSLKAAGIEDIAAISQAEDEQQSIEAFDDDDPVRGLVHRFLGRFVVERGRNQRTRLVITCLRGLGGIESHFTKREIIPEMRRSALVTDVPVKGKQGRTLMFNNAWQADVDAFLWDNRETEPLREIIARLRQRTGRYSLY